MRQFSKELEELDKNTVQYMIDEMQATIEEQKTQPNEKDNQIMAMQEKLDALRRQLEEKKAER